MPITIETEVKQGDVSVLDEALGAKNPDETARTHFRAIITAIEHIIRAYPDYEHRTFKVKADESSVSVETK